MLRVYSALLVTLLSGATQAVAEGPEVFHTLINEPMRVLPGNSESALYRNKLEFMPRVNAIQVELFGTQGFTCQASVSYVTVEIIENGPRHWATLNAAKRINLGQPGLSAIKIHFNNPSPFETYCHVRALGVENAYGGGPGPGPGPTPPPSGGGVNLNEFQYVGKISYDGGFSPNLELPVAPASPSTHVWLRVPSFCDSAEILEVLWLGQGQWVKTTPLAAQKGVYSFSTAAAGVQIGGIRILVNGPRNMSCDIPIYMRILGNENPFEP